MDERAFKAFEQEVAAIQGRARWEVFRDFCEMGAIAYQNAFLQDQGLEDRYLRIAGHYEREDLNRIAKMLAVTAEGLHDVEEDFLGQVFMRLELSDAWGGQFFTPLALCQLMARMNLDGLEEALSEKSAVTIHDPACGSGAMALACAREFLDRGLNPQTQMRFSGIEKDATTAYMAYVQLSLLGIPAEILVGNSLTMEFRERWVTPSVPLAIHAARGMEGMMEQGADVEMPTDEAGQGVLFDEVD
jgi:type I restriction-modification system DNA methylase subunit